MWYFSKCVLIICVFRGNLLIICYGRIMWSQKVVCILDSMCGPVSIMNCSKKINVLYYCVICGPIFDYVVVLYTKRKIKHQNFEIDHLDITSIHNLYEKQLNYENVQHFYVMEF